MHGRDDDPHFAFRYRMDSEAWRPALEVYETESALVVRVDLAGIDQENLSVAFDGDLLLLEGERQPPERAAAAERRQYHEMGVPYGPFKARLRLPFPVDRDATEAEYEYGFLTVRLPRLSRVTIPVAGAKTVAAVGAGEADADDVTRKDDA